MFERGSDDGRRAGGPSPIRRRRTAAGTAVARYVTPVGETGVA